ncbi:hypothetical protein GCM10023185_35970 [Hymenobacter saemangeumensis]|uniref:DUF92 domain-containing protein n=1 Tax=Hymenobacter saemangeumensis TaxID=1084522 RepID=A0ABP8IRC5_9BACT
MTTLASVLCALPVLALGMAYSWRAGKLTGPGVVLGGCSGLVIALGGGLLSVALLTLFFLLGSAASAWKVADKRRLGLAEANQGRRTAGQVWANAGVATLLALAACLLPAYAPLARLMLAGSLAAAAADTLSSELGNVYGRSYYNILSWRPDTRGENGVISLEGTLCGVLGAALLAAVYAVSHGQLPAFWWLIIAGTAGNLADALLGATLERRHYLGNNAVNFFNTLVGALVAGWLGM